MNTLMTFGKREDARNPELRNFIRTTLTSCAAEIDRTDEIGADVYAELARLGLMAYEPRGVTSRDGSVTVEADRQYFLHDAVTELAAVSPAVAKAVLDQNVGQVGMVREYAPAEVSGPLLAAVARGEVELAFAMTEPQGGSQVRTMTTTANRVPGGYEISGVKDWITGAHRRRFIAVVARDAANTNAVGLFLVDQLSSEAGVVTVEDRKQKLGLRGLGEFTVRFDRAFVREHNVIVPPSRHGLKAIMKHYNVKRCAQAAIAQGISRGATDVALAYGGQRFVNAPDAARNLASSAAQLVVEACAGEQLRQWALEQVLDGDTSGVSAAAAKLFCTELAVRVTSTMAQACGANGWSDKLPLERLGRDARMLTVAGGASEVLRGTVARHLSESEVWNSAVAPTAAATDPHPSSAAGTAGRDAGWVNVGTITESPGHRSAPTTVHCKVPSRPRPTLATVGHDAQRP